MLPRSRTLSSSTTLLHLAPRGRRTLASKTTSATTTGGDSPEARLAALRLKLPTVTPPKGSYVLCQYGKKDKSELYLAGHLPKDEDDSLITGKVGKDLTTAQANKAAERVALSLMATLKHELGSLERVEQVVKLVGFVNCVDSFAEQPAVINGASDLLGKVFGEKGRHARSAMGTNALPLNVCCEIEMIVRVAKKSSSSSSTTSSRGTKKQ